MYLQRICSSEVSVGHSYNLIDLPQRNILNVETASRNRISVCGINAEPFFHANMYLHLQIPQVIWTQDQYCEKITLHWSNKSTLIQSVILTLLKVQDENSRSRKETAALLRKQSKDDFLALLGNTDDKKYPIYMTGTQLIGVWSLLNQPCNSTNSAIFRTNVVHIVHGFVWLRCTLAISYWRQPKGRKNCSCIPAVIEGWKSWWRLFGYPNAWHTLVLKFLIEAHRGL